MRPDTEKSPRDDATEVTPLLIQTVSLLASDPPEQLVDSEATTPPLDDWTDDDWQPDTPDTPIDKHESAESLRNVEKSTDSTLKSLWMVLPELCAELVLHELLQVKSEGA